MTKLERILTYKKIAIKYDDFPLFSDLDNIGFFTAPASAKYHSNCPGGLFDHSLAVMNSLVDMTFKLGLKWENDRSPYLVGLFHDLCKCGQYKKKYDEIGYEKVADLIIPGHGDRSVILLQKYVELTDEEIACIRWHMGAYETDTRLWKNYGAAVRKYPNVLFTHTADMYADKVLGV